MEMFCPECMSPLISSDGNTAVCPTHGGSYQILFARYPLAVRPAVGQPGVPGMPPPLPGGYGIQPEVNARCIKHPDSPAVVLCHNCRAPICATCDFSFPGDIHLCPNCAANPNPQISPKRKRLIAWSIALAGVSVVGLIGLILVATALKGRAEAEAVGIIGELFSFLPALIGVALGVGSIDRRLRNPGVVWIGIVGNGAVLVIWLILVVIGLTMR